MRRHAGGAALLGCALAFAPLAQAAPVDPDEPVTLAAAGAQWTIRNSQDPSAPGLVVESVQLGALDDAVDFASRLSVGGEPYVAPSAELVGQIYTGDEASIGGLEVSVRDGLDDALPVLGTLTHIRNPQDQPVSTTLVWETALAEDDDAEVVTTSSGDALWTPIDRWVVVDDDLDGAAAPASVFITSGPGSPDIRPARTFLTTSGDGSRGVRAEFDLSVPAGQSAVLLFLIGLADTREHGILLAANADAFLSDLDLVEVGLPGSEVGQIGNFDLPRFVPGLGAWAVGAAALLAAGYALLRSARGRFARARQAAVPGR